MSSFYLRDGEPESGDSAITEKYGYVLLVAQVRTVCETFGDDNIWLVEDHDDELHLVRQRDLTEVGYYGD
jgi:hypothetical protein